MKPVRYIIMIQEPGRDREFLDVNMTHSQADDVRDVLEDDVEEGDIIDFAVDTPETVTFDDLAERLELEDTGEEEEGESEEEEEEEEEEEAEA